MKRNVLSIAGVLCAILLLAACGNSGAPHTEALPEASPDTALLYRKISAGEAKQMMDDNTDITILDVRTQDEFLEKRIAAAVLLPHTDIASQASAVLPDKDAVVLVYCRTGIRSETAAAALIQLGYTQVYDIGGIEDWPYDTVNGAEGSAADDTPGSPAGELVITFDYEKQPGSASNQFAVWIEDTGGRLIKTLYVTRFTADGGYAYRPDSIPLWTEKASLSTMEQPEIDAVSGATPQTGTLSYTWDLTDADGTPAPPGEYRFCVEGTLRWKNRVIYSGVMALDGAPVTAGADAEYMYEGAGEQPALTDAAPEHDMISGVTAVYTGEGE